MRQNYTSVSKLSSFLAVLTLVLLAQLATLSPPAIRAEEKASVVIVDGWGLHGYKNGKEIAYQWYEKKTEAEAAKREMEKVETTTGKYYDKIDITAEKGTVQKSEKGSPLRESLKEAKEGLDRAKKIDKGEESVFKAAERKLGDTIKEYKDMLKKSFEQAMEVKATVSSGVSKLSESKFKQANQLVDKYNSELVAFQSIMGGKYKTGFSPIPRIQAAKKSDDSAKTALRKGPIGTWKEKTGTWTWVLVLRSDHTGDLSYTDEKGKVRHIKSYKWEMAGEDVVATQTTETFGVNKKGSQHRMRLKDDKLGTFERSK